MSREAKIPYVLLARIKLAQLRVQNIIIPFQFRRIKSLPQRMNDCAVKSYRYIGNAGY